MGRPIGSKNKKKSQIDLIIDEQYKEYIENIGNWHIGTGGYIYHSIKNKDTNKISKIRLHRVIYELVNGPIPKDLVIDHIDGNKTNNLLANLRLVTPQENCWNQTKAKGCYWDKHAKKWRAQIAVNNIVKYLGLFDSESEARQEYLSAKQELHIIQDRNKSIAVA